MNAENRTESKNFWDNHKNWLVLIIAILLAVSAWLLWVLWGIGKVHDWVGSNVAQATSSAVAPVSSQTPATNSSSTANLAASKTGSPTGSPTAAPASLPVTGSNEAEPDKAKELREKRFAEIGQTGDAFGGLNTLLTALAGAFVFWAGYMQHQALKHAQNEAKEERLAREAQAEDSRKAIEIAEKTAKSAADANQLARDSYIATQRAWLKVGVSVYPNGALKITKFDLTLSIDLSLENVGNSPALNVYRDVFMLIQPAGDFSMNLQDFFMACMADEANRQRHLDRALIFAGDVAKAEILLGQHSLDSKPLSQSYRDGKSVNIYIFCYATYQVLGDASFHKSGFIYRLIQKKENSAPSMNISMTEQEIPFYELHLVKSPVEPGYLD